MSGNEIHFLLHMSNRFDGASVNVKPDSGAYNEESSAVWTFTIQLSHYPGLHLFPAE